MDDSLTCQSGREDSQEAGGEGEEDEDEEEGDEEEEEEEEEGEGEEDEDEDDDEDYREGAWRNSSESSRRVAGRMGGAGRGGPGREAAMHEDSTATSFSDVTLYMDEGCLSSSPLSRPPSSTLSRPASSSDTEYWGGGGGGGREDSRETEGGNNASRRSSTPCTECRGEYRARAGGGGGGGGHLPVLTIEPPSDSSVDMSDRLAQLLTSSNRHTDSLLLRH